jgi:hypothetical protein
MERLTTNDQLRAAKRDWALAQCAKEKAAVADLIIAAVRSTKGRIMDDPGNDAAQRINQLRGVRRLVASLGDALVTKDPGFDLPRFFSDCGYGS